MNEQRRKFIKQTSAAATGIAILPSMPWTPAFVDHGIGSEQILRTLAVLNDKKITVLLPRQMNHPGHRWDGGVMDNFELPNAHSTYSFITTIASSYVCEYSSYFRSTDLEKPLDKAITCLLNVQYEDGTIDLHTTNFHSTPDTAFLINYLSPVYVCMKRMNQSGLGGFLTKLGKFFLRAGECLISGGIHTANHRWVVCSALARLHVFFPDPRYLNRMNQWLGEGIDVDPDGQYTERSVSVYTPICNNMFLTIGRLLDKPDILDIVRKNLTMSLYYIQPDGEVLTDASDRQDRAYKGFVHQYYYAYRYFAIRDRNPDFAAVCDLIEKKMPERITRFILLLLEDPIFKNDIISPGKIPDNYFKRFEHSGVFRIRRGQTDISIIEQNPTFLSFRKGNAVLQSMRLGASFFGRGQFVAEEVEFDGKTIILKRILTRGYYQPIPSEKQSGENDWKKVPRNERDLSELQTLVTTVTISESEGIVTIEAVLSGTPHVPVTWEMSFRDGGTLEGVTNDMKADGVFFLEEGQGKYRVGEDVITFGSGAVTHKWYEMRGLLPKQEGKSVYVTGYTPFKHTIVLG